jgi:hypothetical protein
VDDDIFGVALPKLIPLLTAEDVEIQIIEVLKVGRFKLLLLGSVGQLVIARAAPKQRRDGYREES